MLDFHCVTNLNSLIELMLRRTFRRSVILMIKIDESYIFEISSIRVSQILPFRGKGKFRQ